MERRVMPGRLRGAPPAGGERSDMSRKILLSAVVCAAVLCCVSRLHAQRGRAEDGAGQTAAGVEAGLNDLQLRQEQSQRELGAKLDRILANQERILRELEIIKVRASLKS